MCGSDWQDVWKSGENVSLDDTHERIRKMVNEKRESAYKDEQNPTKIYLKVDNLDDEADELDVVNVVVNMAKRRRLYRYLFVIAACAGVIAGLLMVIAGQATGKGSYAQAVITFQYEGIEEGLDPNGSSFDINKFKSPVVIEAALTSLEAENVSVESVRRSIVIEGVIPEDAVERITVINEMAQKDATQYEKILDVTYFPAQYVITLYQIKGTTKNETRDILNALLESYKSYFLETYANTDVLTVTSNLIEYKDYDYAEAVDMLQSQMDIMLTYVQERQEQAPDFRSVNTGLSFGDIVTSLETIENVDMANLSSYIETNTLTKDKERQVEYYAYRIKKDNMELSALQQQLATVQETIDSYEKDPVVIVSAQESTQEISQNSEYYDQLIERKIELSDQIATINTEINDMYTQFNTIIESSKVSTQSEYDKADGMLERLTTKLSEWTTLIEDTTEEYYSTTLFSNAVKIAVPAQFHAAGGIVEVAKKMLIGVGAMILIVVLVWGVDGLRIELAAIRSKKNKISGDDVKNEKV
ncbi:MAG: hypothetical protein NC313_05690 [Butyrivibrio sp.]|nr:hypothetical protein [Butyrivibrio sp.]